MESFGKGNRKEKIGKRTLYAAMLAANLINPDGTAAGKREALSKSDGLKVSQVQDPASKVEQSPDDEPKVKFRIKESDSFDSGGAEA